MNEDSTSNAAAPGADSSSKPLGDVIAINEGLIKDHFDITARRLPCPLTPPTTDSICRPPSAV